MDTERFKKCLLSAAIFFASNVAGAQAISGTDILNLLVEEGVLTEDAAQKLIEKVRQRSERVADTQEQEIQPEPDTVRVPYVPGYVKQEIQESVASDVRGKVLEDLISHAKTERWGVPNAQPSWTNRVKISGDMRLRYQADFYDDDNNGDNVFDINEVNDSGDSTSDGFLRRSQVNVNDDRHRLRARARLNIKAKPTQGMEVGMRLTTGNEGDPVSANQTLGGFNSKWDTNFDLAYLKYNNVVDSVTLVGGRFKNPFLHTDLVWDSDMTFQGLSGTWNFLRSDDLDEDERQWDPFITISAFPIDEVHLTSLPADAGVAPTERDKWLYAAQIGTHYDWWDQSRLSVGLAYYKYENISGVFNEVIDSDLQDPTASDFYQFGNWVYQIKNPSVGNTGEVLFGLASEYELANFTVKYDYAGFSPYRVVVAGDIVQNLAFDAEEIGALTNQEVPDRDTGYQLGVKFGWPNLDLRGNWRVSFDYRRLEGDAVLDAFADSDFLLGGTNAKGYILRGDYAVMDNVAATLRWVSAEEIDADIIDNILINRLFLDLQAKF